jgi:hypothetical protein
MSLNNVKKGRIHLAVTVEDISEVSGKHYVYFLLFNTILVSFGEVAGLYQNGMFKPEM